MLSSSSSSSSTTNGPNMGMWCSVAPPKPHKCSFCTLSFDSLKALGGHQNAHRYERRLMMNEPPPPPPNNGDEIDLELRLTCGPPPSPTHTNFHEFFPLKRDKLGVYGYAASAFCGAANKPTRTSRYHPYYDQPSRRARRELPLMDNSRLMGASLFGGFGVAGGGFGEPSASSAANERLELFPGLLEDMDNTATSAGIGAFMDDGLDLTLKL